MNTSIISHKKKLYLKYQMNLFLSKLSLVEYSLLNSAFFKFSIRVIRINENER